LSPKGRGQVYTSLLCNPSPFLYIYISPLAKFNSHLTLLSSFSAPFPSTFGSSIFTKTMNNKAYAIIMGLMLTSIGIKYGGSNTNPFQHSTPILLLFLTAACSHLLASTAQTTCPTIFIFHVSGAVGCEALVWILIAPQFLWCYVINLFLLLLAYCLNYNQINQLINTLLLVAFCLDYNQIKELICGITHDSNSVSRARLCV